MKNEMPLSTRIAITIMLIALFILMVFAKNHPEQQTVEEEHWM
jgi:hypothetical protein